jgi:hypothetical protein
MRSRPCSWLPMGRLCGGLHRELVDQKKFREYFKQNISPDQDRWDAVHNKMTEHHLDDLLTHLEILRTEISFSMAAIEIDDKRALEFLKRLSATLIRMRNTTLDYDSMKSLGGFLWESRLSIMTLIFMAMISTSGSAALIYNFRMIRTFADRNFGLIATNTRLALAFLVSIACDLGAVIILLVAVVLLGKVAGPRLEELFGASLTEHTFKYGVALALGDATQSESYWSYGLTATDVQPIEFGELRVRAEKPRWPRMIFATEPLYVGDAGKICDQYAIDRNDCADRMRAMFLRHSDLSVPSKPHVAREMAVLVGSLACGHNLWSGLSAGLGSNQALKLALPFAASLAALVWPGRSLSRG